MSRASEPSVRFFTFEEMLRQDGYIVFTNVGRSMLPLLRQRRDVIEIRPVPGPRCRKYDVVLYRRGGQYILHRVLKVLPQGYLIAGDHNLFVERDVTDAMILGVMTRVIRGGRSIRPTDLRYRLYVRLWCAPWRLRMAVQKAGGRVKGFLYRLRRAGKQAQ